jgi:UDP:flavonoid glycosyltransferase YjiC (YdhE family)
MKFHFAAGLGLLEHCHRPIGVEPDRRVFGPILDIPLPGLPSELRGWLDRQRPNSVLFVAFGSMVTLSARRMKMLLSAFEAFGASTLWALGGERMGLSTRPVAETIRFESFVPQPSVLSHPAVGTCITHGGAGTVLECLTASVPMVVMPIAWDQPYNAQLVEELGAGIRIEWWRLNDRALLRALRSIHRSPDYRGRLAALASELRDQEASEGVLRFLENIAAGGDTQSWVSTSTPPPQGSSRHLQRMKSRTRGLSPTD